MKNLCTILFAIILSFACNAYAQKDTLITDANGMIVIDHSKDDFQTILGSGGSHGGYISFDLQAGQTSDDQNLLELGGRIGWIMNHGFTFGLAGYGLAGSIKKEVLLEGAPEARTYNLGGGYGGIFIEPIILPKQPIHVSFPVMFGVGAFGYYVPYDINQPSQTYEYGAIKTDVVTVIKPGVDVEFNITRFFRLALSANYRLVNNLELALDESGETPVMLDKNYLNGFNYGFSLKFGWF